MEIESYQDNVGMDPLFKAGAKKYMSRMNRGKMFNKNILSYLVDIHNSFSQNKIDVGRIELNLENLEKFLREIEKHYLFSLVYPEHPKAKNVRIPTKFPIPSFTFQQKSSFTLTPNASGNFCIQLTPQTLFDNTSINTGAATNYDKFSSIWVSTVTQLDGITLFSSSDTTTKNYFDSFTNDFILLQNAIQVYRLVSCTMLLSYIGSIDQHSGIMGGCVDISYENPSKADMQYSIFSNIDDKMFSIQTIPFNGLKLNYFPKDYSDFNFLRICSSTVSLATQGVGTHVRLVAYGQNLPRSAAIRVEIIKNFEAIASSGFVDLTGSGSIVADNSKVSNDNGGNEMALMMGAKMGDNGLISMPLNESRNKEAVVKNIIKESDNTNEYLNDESENMNTNLKELADNDNLTLNKRVLSSGLNI